MSSSLYWEPSFRARKILSYDIKCALQKKYGGTIHNRQLSEGDIPYLQGLQDAGVKDAKELIEALEKFHSITLDEES